MLYKLFHVKFDADDFHFDQVHLALIINIFHLFILAFFALLHYIVDKNYLLISLKVIFFLITVAILYHYKKTKNEDFFLKATTTTIFFMSLLYLFLTPKVVFSSIWLFFFPFIAYLLNDLTYAKKWVITYLVIIISYVYNGIGVFTDVIGFLYITIALSFFIYFFYQFEQSRREAYKERSTILNKLQTLSMIDALTNLYNRHFLNKHILQNKKLLSQPFLFCITDIDNFKLYNDTYGHQKGDDVLKTIADVKKLCLENKSDSFVFRLGGEEFGAFIFNEQNAKEKVIKFLDKVQNLSIEHKANPPYYICTVSIGAVICNNNSFDFNTIYQLADEALYEAKRTGKNKIVFKEITSEQTAPKI